MSGLKPGQLFAGVAPSWLGNEVGETSGSPAEPAPLRTKPPKIAIRTTPSFIRRFRPTLTTPSLRTAVARQDGFTSPDAGQPVRRRMTRPPTCRRAPALP